jgi:hypothetical protein
MSRIVRLDKPLVITLSEDIGDPDVYIDTFVAAAGETSKKTEQLAIIKSLDHDLKVRWLLSLCNGSDPQVTRNWICTTIIVTAIVIVVVGYKLLNGAMVPITEKKKVEKEVQKCYENELGSGTPSVPSGNPDEHEDSDDHD